MGIGVKMSAQLITSTSIKLVPSSTIIIRQQVRFKKWGKWIVPHRKPRWIPMARSKMFVDPPKSLISKEETDHIEELKDQYMVRMRALHMYLLEDDLKNSDTGEAGKIAAKKEDEEHIKMIQLNEEENKKVAARRVARLKLEAEERKIRIARELEEFGKMEKQKIEMENRIRVEDLEKAIEIALANPVDFEYAIDTEGNIFRGRSTKSKKMDPKDYEKIPLANEGN